ncbi:MAG: hypothetical protein A2428_11420 [Bdellovibrionales bacterium RIFOXYC1_FULL_54_43]|nr:MAG: hypothetical protein A2428_11420 [Bdellovibrionales bacterium RIFOXYC1_FULL_54_43]OFZ78604.1 MAG: hypothetical protein A2603_00655 [Bdellovibrionales bacterium RIFOXYD1_FULL_55_31]
MFESFSNRELATGIWALLIFPAALCSTSKGRKSLAEFIKVLAGRAILITLSLLFVYVCWEVWLLEQIGIWDRTHLKDTYVWFLFSALAIFLKYIPPTESNQIAFGALLKETLCALVIFEFIVNFYTFSLPTELLLVPVVSLIAITAHIAEKTPEHRLTAKILSSALGLFVVYALYHTIRATIADPAIFSVASARQLLVPSLLTVLFIPALYLFALYAAYEMMFFRISWNLKKHPGWQKRTKWRAIKTGQISLRRTQRLSKVLARTVWNAKTLQEVESIFERFCQPPIALKPNDRVKVKTTRETGQIVSSHVDFAFVRFPDGDAEIWIGNLEVLPDGANSK